MEAPFTWIVRFDVAPEWVTDGFSLGDDRALEMLGSELGLACMATEISARVLMAPDADRIAQEQGYSKNRPDTKDLLAQIKSESPSAYGRKGDVSLEQALTDAIDLLDSVPFVRSQNDGTARVLSQLRDARDTLRGEDEQAGDA